MASIAAYLRGLALQTQKATGSLGVSASQAAMIATPGCVQLLGTIVAQTVPAPQRTAAMGYFQAGQQGHQAQRPIPDIPQALPLQPFEQRPQIHTLISPIAQTQVGSVAQNPMQELFRKNYLSMSTNHPQRLAQPSMQSFQNLLIVNQLQ